MNESVDEDFARQPSSNVSQLGFDSNFIQPTTLGHGFEAFATLSRDEASDVHSLLSLLPLSSLPVSLQRLNSRLGTLLKAEPENTLVCS